MLCNVKYYHVILRAVILTIVVLQRAWNVTRHVLSICHIKLLKAIEQKKKKKTITGRRR